MAYNVLQQASLVPSDGHFPHDFFALTFPKSWTSDLLALYRRNMRNPEKVASVPISRLNAAISAVGPDLVSVATRATLEERPWLLATNPFPQHATDALIGAYLKDLQPAPEDHGNVRQTWQRLATQSLRWEPITVDLLEQATSRGNTAVPAPHLYRLLADVLAARIERAPTPYTHRGVSVAFQRIATPAGDSHAELVSRYPMPYTTRATRNSPERTWWYSPYIRIALRTEPFSPTPRIHITSGIRRWVTGQRVWLPADRDVSVYLQSRTPLLTAANTPQRLALAKLHYDNKTGSITWAGGGPAGILTRLSVTTEFPNPERLAKEPDYWFTGGDVTQTPDGVAAFVVHHTMMGFHGVAPGLMPSERRRLTEWAMALLEPEFVPIAPLNRSKLIKHKPTPIYEDRESTKRERRIPRNATEQEAADITAENQQIRAANQPIEERNQAIIARNGRHRRARLAAAASPDPLVVYLLHDTDRIRDHLLAAAETSLDLTPHRLEQGPAIWSWRAPDLELRIHTRPLGPLGDHLSHHKGDQPGGPPGEQAVDQAGKQRPPRRGDEWDHAITARRRAVADSITRLSEQLGERPRLALVELAGKEAFPQRTTDPKFAIRLGCADAGLVSQFITTHNPALKPGEDDAPFRANAAWEDGLRQIGMRFVPNHTLGEAIPSDLTQIAFWLVKRRADGPTGASQFTPIAILLSPDEDTIMGCSPHTNGWVPYPQLLTQLTSPIRDTELTTIGKQQEATASFLRVMLSQWRTTPTLLLTHAQNTRSRWPWLENGELVEDHISFGHGSPLQKLRLWGKQLRIARLASTDRDEVPQTWAPTESPHEAGISKGLWTSGNSRVFYSTAEKLSTQHVSRNMSKLTPWINKQGKIEFDPSITASNPQPLQITIACQQPGDDPEAWAAFIHQQRFSDDYHETLKYPLATHLARIASEYSLPQVFNEAAQPEPNPSDNQNELIEQSKTGHI